MAFENITSNDIVDRGEPFRQLKDGTWPATVVECTEHPGQKMLMCKVVVVVAPTKDNGAVQGPVELTTFLPAESRNAEGKHVGLARLGNFLAACGTKLKPTGGFDEGECLGKPVRVISRWTKSRDPQYNDRAEILDFLPPAAGQKAVAQYMRPTEDGAEPTAKPAGGPF